MQMTKTTIQDRVLDALMSGETLTSSAIKNKFKAGNPQSVIESLRLKGYSIYLNTAPKKRRGPKTASYRMGKPSRAVIAAGYKALKRERLSS